MVTNKFIQYISTYINQNTPLTFIYCETKYLEMEKALKEAGITDNVDLLCACYSLFYTGLSYHENVENYTVEQPYAVLLGDYISSYVAEQLYKHHEYELLKVFANCTKQIMLSILNNQYEDNLLTNIITTLKKQVT